MKQPKIDPINCAIFVAREARGRLQGARFALRENKPIEAYELLAKALEYLTNLEDQLTPFKKGQKK